LFGVQFLGALNDNIFKNTMLILFAYKASTETEAGLLTNLGQGLFILPFFLFSPLAGQLTDKFDKSRIMSIIKAFEIGIMAVGAVGFYTDNKFLLFSVLFMMGIHSAFFGPAKYSILPQHLKEDELMTGNALVEMGTFLAILIGTLAGGLLAGRQDVKIIAACILGVAMLGWLLSLSIPKAPPTAANLKINLNLFSEVRDLTRLLRSKQVLFNSVLGISWFWYFGATLLAQLATLSKVILHGNEQVVTLLLSVFSVSVGLGAMISAKLSRGDIELGLVPLGALGMSLFAIDLALLPYPAATGALAGVREFLGGPNAAVDIRAAIDLGLIGVFGSLFIVPLYALIQSRAEEDSRSRVIAANNVYNAVFMVGSAVITMALFKIGFNTVQVILFTAILNLVVCAYIFALIPEFAMRFVAWALAGTIYRMRYLGRDHVPRTGPAVLVANHVSFIDWFIVTAASRRPVRFVMDHAMFKHPLLGWLFRLSKAIPIAPAKEDAALKEKAFAEISSALKAGDLVCIFPEGMITRDGRMGPFKPGVERILAADPVPVIPMALVGLWGSFFSRKSGHAMSSLPKPSRRVIHVTIEPPLPPGTKAAALEDKVRGMLESAQPAGKEPVAARERPEAALKGSP
jgi:1-acyl-sn-glycerol-3-phosphate acyltransferase